MDTIGAPELLIILAIVILLFGVGRIGKVAGELGSGIKAFRDGLHGSDEKTEAAPKEPVKTVKAEKPVETVTAIPEAKPVETSAVSKAEPAPAENELESTNVNS